MIGVGTTIFLVNPVNFPSGTSYLLDTYSAAAAYSLRQLKTGVTSVVRVRRSSDNAESDFSASDITDGTLTTWTGANNGFVVTWYDQSGGGNDVTQSTAGSQPKLVSSGSVITTNSLASVEFDGSNDYLQGGTYSAQEGYIFSVAESVPAGGVPMMSVANPSVHNDYLAFQQTSILAQGYAARFLTGSGNIIYGSTNNVNIQTLVTYSSDATNWALWRNGSSESLNTAAGSNVGDWLGDYSTRQFTIGGTIRSSPFYDNGRFQEVIIFNSDESANRTDIESDINTHYSIY